MNTDQVAARIVRGLITIRSAVAKLDSAHVNGRAYEVHSALNTIDDEYFSMRRCIDELVESPSTLRAEPSSAPKPIA